MHNFWALSADTQFDPPANAADYLRILRNHVRLDGPVLDIGCNRGWACQLFSDYTGIDPNLQAIEQAREHWGREGDRASFIHMPDPSAGLPFESGTFELVFAKDVLEHVADPVAFMQDAVRVLRPGGAIYLCTPDAQRWVWGDPTHIRPYPRKAHGVLAAMMNLSVIASGYESVAPGTQVLARITGRGRTPLPIRIMSRLPFWPRNVWTVLVKSP